MLPDTDTNTTIDPDAVFMRELLPALEHIRPAVSRFCYGDVVATEDLLQATAERAWRYRASYRAGSNPRAWLLTIAKHKRINELNRNRDQAGVHSDVSDWPLHRIPYAQVVGEAFERDIDGELDAKVLAARTNEAAASMPDRYLDVWLARTRDELSYQEIAERFDIKLGTVMSRLYRARKHIAAQLEQAA